MDREANKILVLKQINADIRNFLSSLTQDEMKEMAEHNIDVVDVYELVTEHSGNKYSTLTIPNAIEALEGPAGTTPRVIGQGGRRCGYRICRPGRKCRVASRN